MESRIEELPPTPPVTESSTTTDDITSNNVVQETPTTEPQTKEIAITDVVINNESMALNILIAFCQIGHRRNAFNIDETAKLAEAINFFKPKQNPTPEEPVSTNE